jgi:hypothetical protein
MATKPKRKVRTKRYSSRISKTDYLPRITPRTVALQKIPPDEYELPRMDWWWTARIKGLAEVFNVTERTVRNWRLSGVNLLDLDAVAEHQELMNRKTRGIERYRAMRRNGS